jgi:hypothetical protein
MLRRGLRRWMTWRRKGGLSPYRAWRRGQPVQRYALICEMVNGVVMRPEADVKVERV